MPLDITASDHIKLEANEAFNRIDKLHVLLDRAIQDFERVMTRPGHFIDFGAWYDEEDGECNVCMAGAVMAVRLNATVRDEPDHLGVETARRLHAIDQLRMGRIGAALAELHARPVRLTWSQRRLERRWKRHLSYMVDNPEMDPGQAHSFLRSMRRLRADLEAANL